MGANGLSSVSSPRARRCNGADLSSQRQHHRPGQHLRRAFHRRRPAVADRADPPLAVDHRRAVAREQPIQFSHERHVAGNGIDCRYCHTSVEDSPFAGIPPTKTCMNCHGEIFANSPFLQPVRDQLRDQPAARVDPRPRPARLRALRSQHPREQGRGLHHLPRPVDRMALTWQEQSLQMEWCLDCHRNPERYVRPRNQVFSVGYRPPANQIEVGRQLVAEYGIQKLAVVFDVSSMRDRPNAEPQRPRRLAGERSTSSRTIPRSSSSFCTTSSRRRSRSITDPVAAPDIPEVDGRVAGPRRRRRVHAAAAREDRPLRAAARRRHSRQAALFRDRDDPRRCRDRGCSSRATRGGRRRSRAIPTIPTTSARPTSSRRPRSSTSTIPTARAR